MVSSLIHSELVTTLCFNIELIDFTLSKLELRDLALLISELETLTFLKFGSSKYALFIVIGN